MGESLDDDNDKPVVMYSQWAQGWRVCAPAVPGLVVIHLSLQDALNMAGAAAEAVRSEARPC